MDKSKVNSTVQTQQEIAKTISFDNDSSESSMSHHDMQANAKAIKNLDTSDITLGQTSR